MANLRLPDGAARHRMKSHQHAEHCRDRKRPGRKWFPPTATSRFTGISPAGAGLVADNLHRNGDWLAPVLPEKNDQKNNQQNGANTDVHEGLPRAAHPHRGCVNRRNWVH